MKVRNPKTHPRLSGIKMKEKCTAAVLREDTWERWRYFMGIVTEVICLHAAPDT